MLTDCRGTRPVFKPTHCTKIIVHSNKSATNQHKKTTKSTAHTTLTEYSTNHTYLIPNLHHYKIYNDSLIHRNRDLLITSLHTDVLFSTDKTQLALQSSCHNMALTKTEQYNYAIGLISKTIPCRYVCIMSVYV